MGKSAPFKMSIGISVILHLVVLTIVISSVGVCPFSSGERITFEIQSNSVDSKLAHKPKLENKDLNKKLKSARPGEASPNSNSATKSIAANSTQNNLQNYDQDGVVYVNESDLTVAPRLVNKVKANRTDEARKAGYAGTSSLMLSLDDTGNVIRAELLNQLPYGLNERALEVAHSLKFIPAEVNQKRVASRFKMNIHFKSTE